MRPWRVCIYLRGFCLSECVRMCVRHLSRHVFISWRRTTSHQCLAYFFCHLDAEKIHKGLLGVSSKYPSPPARRCRLCFWSPVMGEDREGGLCVSFLFYIVITERYDWHEGVIKCYYVILYSVCQSDMTNWSRGVFFFFFFSPILKGGLWKKKITSQER